MNAKGSTKTLYPRATALAVGLLLAGTALLAAEERRTAAPRDGDARPPRVERAEPSSPPSRQPSYTPSSPSSGSGQSAEPAGRSQPRSRGSAGAARTRPSHSDSEGRTLVDRRRHGGSSHTQIWIGQPYWHWWWGWGPYWWPGYGWRYYDSPYYGYGPSSYRYYEDDAMGALDLDVSPERAEIYLDGQLVGTADDFDGFPTYLWLPKGTYDVVLYTPGFQTIARQYSVYPGVVIDVEDSMVPGEAIRPEDLEPKEKPRRDERVREERRQEQEVERRERAEPRRSPAEESGRLVVKVSPDDASIYLDGRFLGTAQDLFRLHAGLIVEPGEHRLEIVRPGYESESTEISVEPGEEVTVSLDLDKDDE